MIPLITKTPPSLTETSIPVDVKNTDPIKVKGHLSISGDEDNPLPTKIISDEDHPVLVDVVNENFNVYVNNPSPIDVNVVNQLELPQTYPVNVTNQIQLPLEYPIANPYYENSLVFITSCLFYDVLNPVSSTAVDISINSPFTINIENYNEWYFEIEDISVNDQSKNATFILIKNQTNLNQNNIILLGMASNITFVINSNNYCFKTGKINYKGNFNNGDEICKIKIGLGTYTNIAEIRFKINFYCRAKAYYTYLNN